MSWLLPFGLRNGHFNATTTAQIVPFIMSKTVAQSSRLAAADRERVLIVVPVYPQLFTYRALNLRSPENKASEDGKKIYNPLCRSIPHTAWNVKPFLWNVPVECGVFRTCYAIARSMYEKSPQLARDLRGEVAQALRSIGNVASVTDEQIDIAVESQLLKAALLHRPTTCLACNALFASYTRAIRQF